MTAPASEIKSLRETLRHHDHLYYVLEKPEISDREYDHLYIKLKDLEEKNPHLITPDSPTQRVSGTPVSTFKQFKHTAPMLSLDNTYTTDEIVDWDERIRKKLDGQPITYVLNPKIDGLSLSVHYKDGALDKAVTRGDGKVGEDVTSNGKTIKPIPLRLSMKGALSIEVRGEVYMEKKDFEKLNKRLQEEGKETYVNPRNFASGSLRQKDAKMTAQRPLKFYAHSYGLTGSKTFESYTQFLKACETSGIPITKPYRVVKNIKDVFKIISEWEKKKDSWPFEADGVVIRIDNIEQWKELGTTAKSPRWAIAFKYPAQQATTTLLDVEHSVGRTGVVTPTAKLKPVLCGGVTISNASLHNYDEIKRLGVKIGDTVVIERAGEVIPKVIKTVPSKRTGTEKAIRTPTTCPACETRLEKLEGEVAIRCLNVACPTQVERSIIHFASRDAMDIEGMGEAVVEQVLEKKLIKNIADIYTLKKEDLLTLELFADKRAENLVAAIQKSKNQTLDKMIYGLGIPNVGEKAALVLAEQFGSISDLATAKKEDLMSVPDMGPIGAESIYRFFHEPHIQTILKQLKSHGLDPKFKKVKVATSSPFIGKTVVFTGELHAMARSEAQKLVRKLGGKDAGSVSKKTGYVVVGENPGSKAKKAKDLGVSILSEQQFLKMVGSNK